jgi:hypothetical protein
MNATDLRADIQRLQLQNLREASAKVIPAPSREPLEFALRSRSAVLAFLCAPLPSARGYVCAHFGPTWCDKPAVMREVRSLPNGSVGFYGRCSDHA